MKSFFLSSSELTSFPASFQHLTRPTWSHWEWRERRLLQCSLWSLQLDQQIETWTHHWSASYWSSSGPGHELGLTRPRRRKWAKCCPRRKVCEPLAYWIQIQPCWNWSVYWMWKKFIIMILIQLGMSFLPWGFLRKWTPWRRIGIWNHQAPNDEQVIIKVSNSVNLRFQILHLCNISWQSIFIMKAGRITSKHYFDLLSIKAHIQICAPIVSSEFMGLSAPLSRRNFKDVFSQK